METSFSCELLPPIIELNSFWGDWNRYEQHLYEIFVKDFIDSNPMLFGKPVKFRKHPVILDKEQAFFHITSEDTSKVNDPNDRTPDLRRCERIHWVKKIIENYGCRKGCCSFIKYWPENWGSFKRWHFLFEEVKFLVVVEERETYNLLITSFYIEREHQIKKKLKKYHQYKKQETPLIE